MKEKINIRKLIFLINLTLYLELFMRILGTHLIIKKCFNCIQDTNFYNYEV